MTQVRHTAPQDRAPYLDEHLAELRELLEEQRRFRMGQIHDLSNVDEAQSEYSSMSQDELSLALNRRVLALSDIEAALQRIELGTFGRCQRCEADIPLERLRVLPMAALCMHCKQTKESPYG